MHLAMQRWPFRLAANLFLMAFLYSLLSLSAYGQDGETTESTPAAEPIQELVVDLETRWAALQELSQAIAKEPDNSVVVMLRKERTDRRSRFRSDVSRLVTLILDAEANGADVTQARSAASEILQADAQSLHDRLDSDRGEFLENLDAVTEGNAEDAQQARRRMSKEFPASTRLIKYLDGNIDQQNMLGLDTEVYTAYLVERVRFRAELTSGLLKSTKEEIDDIKSQTSAEKDSEAQKQLVALRKQRALLAGIQRVHVTLMDKFGLNTTQLRQGIIAATGKISEDILDAGVVSGLVEDWLDRSVEWLSTNGVSISIQVLTFLLILFAFWVAARVARRAVRYGLDRSKQRISMLARDFFIKMTGRLVMMFGFIIAIAQFDIEIGPLLAGLGIAGFIIGFALQDTLSNFASGLMVLAYRPFDVGDTIEAGGVNGKVKQMNLVSTMILTFDNQLMIVPNRLVWGGIIRNVTHQDRRRVDMTFGIGYSDDISRAEIVLMEIVTSREKVLEDPEPVVRLHQLGDSSVDFVVRPWCKTSDYWEVYWDVTREVKRRFDEEGISIPYPQRDVHIHHNGGGTEKT